VGLGAARKTALVTGAAGFLGSHLVDRLLAEGYEVVGLDNLMTGDLTNLRDAGRSPHFHFQAGDVRDPVHVYAELVLNFACPASPIQYQRDPYATFTTSVFGAHRLAEMMRGRRCVLVHASTSEVYGDPTVHPQPESYWGNVNPVGVRSCYDEGKRAAETLLNDVRRLWNLDVRIARIFNTYGPRMAFADGRAVSTFIAQALQGKALTIHGDGAQTRSFCYVEDLVDGIVRLAHHEVPLDRPVNLGNPVEHPIRDLAASIVRLTGSASRIVHVPPAEDDPAQRRPDIGRAHALLGFAPAVPLEVGLARTIDDFRARMAAVPA
jgi:UDP-glucuronate decarboxylase